MAALRQQYWAQGVVEDGVGLDATAALVAAPAD